MVRQARNNHRSAVLPAAEQPCKAASSSHATKRPLIIHTERHAIKPSGCLTTAQYCLCLSNNPQKTP